MSVKCDQNQLRLQRFNFILFYISKIKYADRQSNELKEEYMKALNVR